ncbi:Fanconi anemia group D2 protein [Coelomomyces lativittatus]|nr:Fanconi anemia group D2 protein [Coelomomyces lativittatus]
MIPLTSPSWVPLVETISNCLVSAQEHEVPILLRFLLNISPSISFSPQERILFLRSHLDISDLSNVTLVLEEYRVALRRHKSLYNAYKHLFLQLTAPAFERTPSSSSSSSSSSAWQDIDVLVWILMGSLSPSACKDMERVLKTCMLNQTLMASHFKRVLEKYANCLQPYHATLRSFLHSFFTLLNTMSTFQGAAVKKKKSVPSASFPSNMTPSVSWYKEETTSMHVLDGVYVHALVHAFVVPPFQYFEMEHQQDWMAVLVAYVGSGTSVQVEMALTLLTQLAETCATHMVPFTLLIKGLLDYLDNLSLPQIRSLFVILTRLAWVDLHEPSQVATHPTLDALSILARKSLARFHVHQRAIGVVAMASLIEVYAAQRWEHHPEVELCFSIASEHLNGCDQACTEPVLRAFFYDQLAYFIEPYKRWHPAFLPFVFHTYFEHFVTFTQSSTAAPYSSSSSSCSCSSSSCSSSSNDNGKTDGNGDHNIEETSKFSIIVVDLSPKKEKTDWNLVTETKEWDPSLFYNNGTSSQDDQKKKPDYSATSTLFFLDETAKVLPSLLRLIYAASQANPDFQAQVLPFFEARLIASSFMKNSLIMYLQQCVHCLPKKTNTLLNVLEALATLAPSTPLGPSKSMKSKHLTSSASSSPLLSSSSSSSSSSLSLGISECVFPEQVFELVLPTCQGTTTFSYLVSSYFTYLQSNMTSKPPSVALLLCLCESLVTLSHSENTATLSTSTASLMGLIFQILGIVIQRHSMDLGRLLTELAQGLSPFVSSSPSFDAATQDPFLLVFDFFSAFVPSAPSPSLAKLIFLFLLLLHARGCPGSISTTTNSSALSSSSLISTSSASVWDSRFHDIAADYLSQPCSSTLSLRSDVLEFFLTQELRFSTQPLLRLREYTNGLLLILDPSSAPTNTMYPLLTKATFSQFYKICFRRLSSLISTKIVSELDTLIHDDLLSEPLIEYLSNITPIFVDLVQLTKLRDQKSMLQIALNEGSRFVSQYTLILFPAISKRFLKSPKLFLEWIKKMQPGTRQLQAICGYSKVSANPLLISQVPKTRKILESFLQAAKCLLIQHKCEDAWWIGSLKHRDMQGQVVSSQVPFPSSQQEDNHDDMENLDEESEGQESDHSNEGSEMDPLLVTSKPISSSKRRVPQHTSQKRKVMGSSDEEEVDEVPLVTKMESSIQDEVDEIIADAEDDEEEVSEVLEEIEEDLDEISEEVEHSDEDDD